MSVYIFVLVLLHGQGDFNKSFFMMVTNKRVVHLESNKYF